jgi:Mrp family chromosome partitioning ATPase
MTVMQSLPLDGVVIVSSPQMLATMIVMKCVNMVQQLKGSIVGVVENMSFFQTPNNERYEIFGPSNGTDLVAMTGAPLLGALPIDSALTTLCDAGRVEEYYSEDYEELAANFTNTLKIKR